MVAEDLREANEKKNNVMRKNQHKQIIAHNMSQTVHQNAFLVQQPQQQYDLPEQPFIAISGMIGAGKTSIARNLG